MSKLEQSKGIGEGMMPNESSKEIQTTNDKIKITSVDI